jgi:hypothetical protein
MKGKHWVLGAATGLILVGSLLGVGCKKSNNNASATKTAQSNASKTALSKVTPAKSPTANAATAAKTPAAAGTKAAATATPY